MRNRIIYSLRYAKELGPCGHRHIRVVHWNRRSAITARCSRELKFRKGIAEKMTSDSRRPT